MKRLLITLILLLIPIIGINNTSCNKDGSTEPLPFTEFDRFDIAWDELEFSFDLSENVLEKLRPIETLQDATEVGTAIVEQMLKNGEINPEFSLVTISHSTEDNIWCFGYSIDQRNTPADKLIDCYAVYVAIYGDTGEFLKAWPVE